MPAGMAMAMDHNREPGERLKRIRARNLVALGVLAGFALLLYLVTILRVSGGGS